jgi:hypothetical protein
MKQLTIQVPLFVTISVDEQEFESNKDAILQKITDNTKDILNGCFDDGDFASSTECALSDFDIPVHEYIVTTAEIATETDIEDDEPTINIKLKNIVTNDLACDGLGYNPYCVNEGADGNELIAVKLSKAKLWGLV